VLVTFQLLPPDCKSGVWSDGFTIHREHYRQLPPNSFAVYPHSTRAFQFWGRLSSTARRAHPAWRATARKARAWRERNVSEVDAWRPRPYPTPCVGDPPGAAALRRVWAGRPPLRCPCPQPTGLRWAARRRMLEPEQLPKNLICSLLVLLEGDLSCHAAPGRPIIR